MASQIPATSVDQLPRPLPDDLAVLDVREDDEWAAGHIDGAQHIPLAQVPTRVDEVPQGQKVVVVCRSGGRSARATGFLQSQGRDAVNLSGGMKSWQAAGRAMTSDGGAAPDVI